MINSIGFAVRGVLLLEFKPLLVSSVALSHLPILSAFHFFVYFSQSLSSLENHCRDEMRGLNKISFNIYHILLDVMLVKIFFLYMSHKLCYCPGIRKDNHDTGRISWLKKYFIFYPSVVLEPITRICLFLLL